MEEKDILTNPNISKEDRLILFEIELKKMEVAFLRALYPIAASMRIPQNVKHSITSL